MVDVEFADMAVAAFVDNADGVVADMVAVANVQLEREWVGPCVAGERTGI